MVPDNLRQLLSQVHERLGSIDSLDEEARELLISVVHDIEKALARGEASHSPAAPRLESLAIDFQAEHPALAGVLRQLIDALGKAGI